MHPNAELLTRLFTSLDRHDHQSMADCYDKEATFTDIAFDLHGKKQIHAMWHMISKGDIRATFQIDHVDDQTGVVSLVDDYTFKSTCRKVHNVIESHFCFQDGLITEHRDTCDARQWARMALGGITGFLAGRLRFLRSLEARRLLDEFIEKHPQYR